MNQRENLLSLLRRQGYSYHPVEFMLCPDLVEKFKDGAKNERAIRDYFKMPWDFVQDGVLSQQDKDVFLRYYDMYLKEGTEIDQWGVAHERGSEAAMHMTRMRNPMVNLNKIEEFMEYPFPNYSNADYSHQKAQCDQIHERGLAAVGPMQMTIWETAWYMRGMEQLMMDMIADKEKASYLFDKILELSIIRGKKFASAGCDIIYLGDDIGMQSSIMMSLDMYLEWFKPRLKRLIKEIKETSPNVLIFYHSCGYVEPFIPHLIEVGVDVLNPIQPESMDFKAIHEKYGTQISFHGTIGTQTTMPFGTVEEVKNEVKKNLTIAGKKGGLFCAPTHLLEPDVPWENIIAYVEACREFDPNTIK